MDNLLKRFKYIIIIILAVIIFFISFTNYRSTKRVIEEKYESRQLLVEKNILQTVNYINNSYKIAEEQLNSEMKKYSQLMSEKYKNNSDVMSWDLEELKQKFAGYEIYIIDKNLKIIKTTNKEDLGLDFSRYKSFAKVLRERLNGDSFVVDRIDLATQTGEIKKYSYMPTYDNQYLLELSVEVQDKYSSLKRLDMFRDASELTTDYDMVEEISFFSVEPIDYQVAKLRSSKKPYLQADVAKIEDELARKTVLNKKVQTKTVKTENNTYTYKFFPALIADREDKESGWNSYVVGITYNDKVILEEISKHRGLFTLNILIMLIVFISFISVVIYLLNKFEYQAYHDQLTGLANRELFEEEFARLKKKANKSKKLAILFLDIDKFKMINDNFGHHIGDLVLQKIANRLKNNLKDKDCLARLGGDEFVIIITNINSKEQATNIADRVIDEFKDPLLINDNKIFVNLSGGISIYPDNGNKLDELVKNADYAMYKAKRKKKDLIVKKNEKDE